MKKLMLSLLLLPILGCGSAAQRFVPISGNVGLALDTKTGRTCYPTPKPVPGQIEVPRCYDLYQGK